MTKSEQGRFKINEILNYNAKWAWEECIVINILKGIMYVQKWRLPPTEEIKYWGRVEERLDISVMFWELRLN